MAIASGSRVRTLYVAEVTHGTTPSTPTMKTLRVTDRNLNFMKNILTSAEVRADRQVSDLRHGFNKVEGSLGFELCGEVFNDMIEGAMGGTWAAITFTGNIQAVAATQLFTRASGSWITDGYRVGDYVTSSGFSNSVNNGTFRVTAVTAADLSVDTTVIVNEASASRTIAVQGKRIDIGTTLKTYTFERGFLDVNQFQLFRGVAINVMRLDIKPEAIVNGTLEFMGMSSPALAGTTAASVVTAAATNSPFSAFVGNIFEGGSSIAVVTGVDFTLDNGRTLQPVLMSKFSPDVFEGTAKINGTMTVLFENATYFNKFVNETASSLLIKLDDPDGTNFMVIKFPSIKYTGGTMNPPQEGPVILTLPFAALVDPVTGVSMSIQRSTSS